MKKLFKGLTILPITLIPTVIAMSCETKKEEPIKKVEKESNLIEDYEKPNPTVNDLKRFYQAYVRIMSTTGFLQKDKEGIIRQESLEHYFGVNFDKKFDEFQDKRDNEKLSTLLDIFTSIKIPSNASELFIKTIIEPYSKEKIDLIKKTIAENKELE
ncbi:MULTISPECIES: hypothetical protein [unclassified Mycoplasma]|uniref:hypothetical protein n=1 Tax=unclassified Mycoplasma TaxID=2683645 RepID=UPI00211C42CB|nr:MULTISPECIES: hypothetical protein [unclassified Mycoplasma]UUM19747.1 hypothetical protein NPA11_03185 [Mycoplasma sp. 1578d]UUM24731.1 hypothetical protein NPA12_03480 [Mycoplasma sp. 3686d]